MEDKEKLLNNLSEKSGKSKEELKEMISQKMDELSGLISEEGAIYIIANDLGVRIEGEKPKRDVNFVKVDEINEPKTPVSFYCKVIRKYDLVNFSSKNGEGTVQSLLVGDKTGITRLVFWNDKTELLENVHDGDVLKIINAYTRENTNQERIEVHYGQYSDIEVNPKNITIEVPEYKPADIQSTEKKVSEVQEGDRNVKITAVITDFEIPRFYLGCPECFKKVMQDDGSYNCAEHGEIKVLRVPIVNLIVDDSTGTINVVGFRDRAEKITGLNSNEVIKLAEDIDKYRDFTNKIIGSKITLIGNVGVSQMTGDNQILVNQVENIEFKTVDEIVEDLVKKEKPKKNDEDIVDDDLEDIEEIDIDDDLL